MNIHLEIIYFGLTEKVAMITGTCTYNFYHFFKWYDTCTNVFLYLRTIPSCCQTKLITYILNYTFQLKIFWDMYDVYQMYLLNYLTTALIWPKIYWKSVYTKNTLPEIHSSREISISLFLIIYHYNFFIIVMSLTS